MSPPHAHHRGQSGVTLLEMALAVLLIGISLLSLIGLLYAILVSSATHQEKIRTGNRASEIAERIDEMIYIPCPGAGGTNLYQGALDHSPDRKYDESITDVSFLVSGSASSPSWSAGCPGTDQGAQRVTVRVDSRLQSGTNSDLVFIKRDMTCPDGIAGGEC